jgi:hypothetical protein
MAKKGLDTTFVHYGIRKEDMTLLEALCISHKLDFDWVRDDILKEFHDRKIKSDEIDEKALERIIEKALQKIK